MKTPFTFNKDTRAVSVQVGTILSLAILSILVSGVIVTIGGFVETQQKATTEKELTVSNERFAAQLMKVDDLATVGSNPSMTIRANTPAQITGNQYTITVNTSVGDPNDGIVTMRVDSLNQGVTIPFKHTTSIENTTVAGGTDIYLTYNSSTGIRITNNNQ